MARSKTAVIWLQSLLTTRLDLPINLEIDSTGWIMSVIGSEGTITFPSFFNQLELGKSPDNCTDLSVTLESTDTHKLVAPGLERQTSNLLSHKYGSLHINYDLPGLILWALTRCEEIGREDTLDEYGRFPAHAAHSVRNCYLDRPIVDEWLMFLGEAMKLVWHGYRPPSFEPKTVVSHDVDIPTRYGFTSQKQLLRRMGGDLYRGVNPLNVLKAPFMRRAAWNSLPKSDPANTFDWIMTQSEMQGLESTFYFITHAHPNLADTRYPFESLALRKLITKIFQRGHKVGLHPSLGTYLNPKQISQEFDCLIRLCDKLGFPLERPGARMHYLQWRAETTPMALAAAGLHHDASLGFADRPGFRAGTAHPYQWYDVETDYCPNLEIRPLILMEQSLISPTYLALSCGEAIEVGQNLKRAAHFVGGTFSLLWHNDMLTSSAQRDLYLKLLQKDEGHNIAERRVQ